MTKRRSRCIVALLAVLGSTPALAQSRPMSEVLLRRLAEAVDGARRDSVWVVASWDSVPRLAGTFTSANAARAAANGLGAQFASFGPYSSSMRTMSAIETPCWHVDFSVMRCKPDTTAAQAVIGVEFVLRDGSRQRVENNVDAVFLTQSAIDKFVVPYYVSVLGFERARQLRDSLLRRRP